MHSVYFHPFKGVLSNIQFTRLNRKLKAPIKKKSHGLFQMMPFDSVVVFKNSKVILVGVYDKVS